MGECTEQQRLILAQNLKRIDKTTCFTGESIADCFAIEESDVGLMMSNHGSEYCRRICDIAFERDVMLIYESIQLGRTIYENIRKFIQYQLTVAINLCIYIFLGCVFLSSSPVPPTTILFINFLMDTMSSNIFSHELPEHNTLLLTETKPMGDQPSSLFTAKMVFNMVTITSYQQIVMFKMFYIGWIGKFSFIADL